MKELNAFVIFTDGGYIITADTAPLWLKSTNFQDEYEANLAWAIWLQYSKNSERSSSGLRAADYEPFRWMLKAIFRIIGIPSMWSK